MKEAAYQFESLHYRNESLIVARSQVQNYGGTIREAESSAVIELHICTMVDPFVLSNLRSNDLFNEALLALQVPESTCTKIQILHFSHSVRQSSGEIWWTITNSVQISLGRSNHHISIKDSYCVGWWLALKELRDRTVLSSYQKISTESPQVVCRCFLPTKMEHHHQRLTELHQKNCPMRPGSWRKSRGSDGSLHTRRHSIRAYCSCACKWGTQFFENFSEALFKTDRTDVFFCNLNQIKSYLYHIVILSLCQSSVKRCFFQKL